MGSRLPQRFRSDLDTWQSWSTNSIVVMRLSGPRRYVSMKKGMKFCLFPALHLQERYVVAFEEKEDLIKVSGAVELVVEHIQVQLGRQKLNS